MLVRPRPSLVMLWLSDAVRCCQMLSDAVRCCQESQGDRGEGPHHEGRPGEEVPCRQDPHDGNLWPGRDSADGKDMHLGFRMLECSIMLYIRCSIEKVDLTLEAGCLLWSSFKSLQKFPKYLRHRLIGGQTAWCRSLANAHTWTAAFEAAWFQVSRSGAHDLGWCKDVQTKMQFFHWIHCQVKRDLAIQRAGQQQKRVRFTSYSCVLTMFQDFGDVWGSCCWCSLLLFHRWCQSSHSRYGGVGKRWKPTFPLA